MSDSEEERDGNSDIEDRVIKLIEQKMKKDQSWIPKLIKKRECTTYVEDASSNGTQCQCGRQRDDHQAPDRSFNTAMVSHWDSAQHSSEYPTDAFGVVEFEGGIWRSPSHFLRLSWDTDPSIVYDLMTRDRSKKGWGLGPPNLVVSVVGGDGSAKVKTWVREVLREGLVKALQRTGAWILTEGLCEGIGRCVGEAVRDHIIDNIAASSDNLNTVVALGIAPWGLVHNRQQLVNPQGSHAKYSVENTIKDSCCLDNNYEAFLLVDDGSAGRRGQETIFRANLEEHISHQHTGITWGSGNIDIPVLCMLISGEATMLERVAASLRNSTPWLVLAGSGGVADLLSDILENLSPAPAVQSSDGVDGDEGSSVDLILKEKVAERVRKHFPSEAQTDKLVEQALSIYQNRDLITVYHGEQERPEDFDTIMLKALVQASKHRGFSDARLQELKLAVTWNRVDIAKSALFNGDINWMDQDLEDFMTDALVNDKTQFVRFFTENGFNIQDYLTYGRLESLYHTVADGTLAHKLLQQHLDERLKTSGSVRSLLDSPGPTTEITIFEVSCVLKKLLGDVKPFYFTALGLEDVTSDKEAVRCVNRLLRGNCEYRDKRCKFPWTTLFIWAVLQNRSEMAVLCWEMAEESVMSALSACKMLREMSKMDCETETNLSMKELAQRFENMAHDMFSSCYQSDDDLSIDLLFRNSPVWDTTCIKMGTAADARIFFSNDAIQSLLSEIWWGHMKTDTQTWKVLLTFFCPVLCYTNLITFSDNETESSFVVSRWHQFWDAPVITFVGNVLMYFLFLLLFAYVLLVDFKPPPPSGPAISEYVLYFWVFTIICEEIRQAFFMDHTNTTLRQSMSLYMQDFWNKCDLTAIVLFIIGLICRLFEWSFEFGRCVLCINYMVFTLRLIHIFAIHKQMGPKIIIVGKMMKDVSFFLFFLGVWIMAYGVANQALLYSYDPNPYRIFRRVFYRPYLHIFGHFQSTVEEIDVGEQWDKNCTDNVTLIEGGAEPCRSEYSNWLVIILLVVYLLVTNVLLINLLIAILSYTFEKVQEKGDIFWKFQRFKLIEEYQSRPTLAPPFIILSHLHLFIKRKICKVDRLVRSVLDLTGEDLDYTITWETGRKKNFLTDQSKILRDSDSERIKRMSDNVDYVLTETRDFDQRLKQMSDKVDRVDRVLKQMETKMENALNQILETLAQSTLDKPPPARL